ncbi:hypothetical protein [Desulfosporosinus sp. Sb-LF]|uniref:hypothetical protein n=1 Tax=Desulfosporosinus sp. Sb-LF TaxID=2560027 RepID=UPI00107F3521|nr:hypothetical protein [Desulfosporosinus sp. Sb-LF]TGE34194.1 hypothetical protein E4K68_00335 [Desulfosporosinus sp. Sb-LF]
MVSKPGCEPSQDRGSALLMVISIIMLFMVITGIYFFLLNYRSRIQNSEENTMKAYYLAQAAVNYGGYILKTSAILPDTNGIRKDDPFGYGGSFTVTYEFTPDTINVGCYYVNVRGTGYYPSGVNPVKRIINTSYFWNPNVNLLQGTIQQQLVTNQGGGNSTLVLANSNLESSLPTDGTMPKLLYATVNQAFPLSVFVWTNGGHVRGTNVHVTNATLRLLDLDHNNQCIPLITSLNNLGTNVYQIPDFYADQPPLFNITINHEYSHVKWQIDGIIATGQSAGSPGETVTVTSFSVTLPIYVVWQQEGN